MQLTRSLSKLAFPACLCAAAAAAPTDRYTFLVDSTQSQVQYDIGTNLGPCTMTQGANGNIAGDMSVVLHPGAFPISDGHFDGGNCGCQPDLIGIVPNSIPGLPPLMEVHVSSLVVSPHSPRFQCDSTGLFLIDTSCDVTNGNVDVSLSGGPFLPVPILGVTSDSTRSHGQVWIDGNGLHIVREIGNTISISSPALGVDLQISIRGVIRGDLGYPPPTRFCAATPNSTGLPGHIDFSGTPSVSRNDGQLLVSDCPAGVTALFITGDQQVNLPFGNGFRCVGGTLLRVVAAHLGATGAGSAALDLTAPPCPGNLVAGSHWNFQCVYRDVAAGGAMFNASDAIGIDLFP